MSAEPSAAATTAALEQHLVRTHAAIDALTPLVAHIAALGAELAHHLSAGGRLLAAGNGGSAAHALHLTSELVGRFDGDRDPFSALCLPGDVAALTAIGNDYGYDDVFARQVRAHARAGDVCVLLSTSGRSPNLLQAARAAHERGARVWAITGPPGSPLATAADAAVEIDAPTTAAVQEAHQVVVHLLCRAFDAALPSPPGVDGPGPATPGDPDDGRKG